MSRNLICLISFVLVLGLVNSASADMMAYWKFDEGSGDTVEDLSGNGNHGTIENAVWVGDAILGTALQFDGQTARVVVPDSPSLHPQTGDITIEAWVNVASDPKTWSNAGPMAFKQSAYQWAVENNSGALWLGIWGGRLESEGIHDFADMLGEWHHAAATYDDVTQIAQIYLDGRLIIQGLIAATIDPASSVLYIGYKADDNSWYHGIIDEVRIWDVVRTQEEIRANMYPYPPGIALKPDPHDGAVDVPRNVVLSWTPGEFADQHDVYFGTSLDDVNGATTAVDPAGVYRGRQNADSYAFGERLAFGQTYYWRIDEVNAPPISDAVIKGFVWRFTVEPVAYPIAGENITATASSAHQADLGPENTINGSGLDDNDLHSRKEADMWLSSTEPLGAWIEYEFDKVYKLHQMWVWNSNQMIEPHVGFGFKDVTIEYSANGIDYTTLGTTHEFARAPGVAGYAHNTTIDFGGAAAKHVKLTANSNWGFMPQFGLSEVRFLYIPIRAREPSPDSGATDVDVDVVLGFRAGREAAQHDVYVSTDEQAVIDGTAPVTTVTEASYGPLSLDLGATYYWKINEVNEAETPTTWEGDLWNFATRQFLVVDDFESYNDLNPDDPKCNRIYNAWIDGYELPANGSQVGYAKPPFCERNIVHGGKQSMPFNYDNSTASYSEGTANVANLPIGQDWTKHGVIKTLSLWFYGDPCNVAQQMYVKLNGSKVTYDGDASNIMRIPWQQWNINLKDFTGVNLSNVTELSIGLERIGLIGGSGVVYFDDISLTPFDRQLVTPVEPGAAGLVAHYEFEGTANDSSVNGLHGTAMGEPAFVAGKVGQAISLRGLNDFVEITGYKGILGTSAVTVTAWINTTSTVIGTIVGWGANGSGQRFGFLIDDGRIRIEHAGGNLQGDTNVNDGAWHHVAVTVQESATISYPEVILYVDGIDDTRPATDPDAFNLTAEQDVRIGSRPAGNDRFFMGLLDDVRIYDRALTPEEIAWLAGRTKPFDKPF